MGFFDWFEDVIYVWLDWFSAFIEALGPFMDILVALGLF